MPSTRSKEAGAAYTRNTDGCKISRHAIRWPTTAPIQLAGKALQVERAGRRATRANQPQITQQEFRGRCHTKHILQGCHTKSATARVSGQARQKKIIIPSNASPPAVLQDSQAKSDLPRVCQKRVTHRPPNENATSRLSRQRSHAESDMPRLLYQSTSLRASYPRYFTKEHHTKNILPCVSYQDCLRRQSRSVFAREACKSFWQECLTRASRKFPARMSLQEFLTRACRVLEAPSPSVSRQSDLFTHQHIQVDVLYQVVGFCQTFIVLHCGSSISLNVS